jgi:hypothetical protein
MSLMRGLRGRCRFAEGPIRVSPHMQREEVNGVVDAEALTVRRTQNLGPLSGRRGSGPAGTTG